MKRRRIQLVALLSAVVVSFCVLSSCETDPILDPPGIQYNPEVKAILAENCLQCHSAPSPIGGIILDNYEDARFAVEFGNVFQRINNRNNPMPPSGLIDFESRDLIKQWSTEGFEP